MPENSKEPASKKTPKKTRVPDEQVAKGYLPVVGIGASAGGLEAFELFFTNMPRDTGMAFVLVQHLDPTHKSILSELVKCYTSMKVKEVQDGMPLEPNTVFVIPPNRYMAIFRGKLQLLEPTELPGLRTPIDYFFRSLAEDQKEKAICIVLSGTGTEGTLGLRAVKGEGGMVMVQEPESAKYDGMPRNAVATALADYILPPQKMPERLISYVEHAVFKLRSREAKPVPKESEVLEKVFLLLRSRTGHDFSSYKHNTILRRIDRRMAVHQIVRLPDYARYLQEDPREADRLFKELLIGVTGFFRDKEAFQILTEKAIAKLFEQRSRDQSIRIWVPGCATGEEAYSIAIICSDVMDDIKQEFSVRVFATDIDNAAIETARQGLYPASISVDVPQEVLDRHFNREESSYRVKKDIRDMVVFATQNVITDPPFSRIDLISCRNLLIYLGGDLQKRVLPLFHYALRKGGFLFLGSSETVGEFSNCFATEDRKWKLFRRKESDMPDRPLIDAVRPVAQEPKEFFQRGESQQPVRKPDLRRVAEEMIVSDYGPTTVIINEKNEILYIHGKAGKYLEPPMGDFSGDIMAMAREGLKLELASAIRKASVQKIAVRSEHLSVKTNGGEQLINLVVKPLADLPSLKGASALFFEDIHGEETIKPETNHAQSNESEEQSRVRQLEKELRSTKEYLQTTIEELETANEELQSSNEGLQSTNEELETSKEELQSVNEELTTVNSEHQQKIEELSKTSSDLNNLLASTEIGTVFLDKNLNIQRFTPRATDFINLIQTDIGRPVSHLVSNIDYADLAADSKQVLRNLVPIEQEVKTKMGRWYQMRILPYRTIENVIDGVVITFAEITKLKEALKALEEARKREALEEARKREALEEARKREALEEARKREAPEEAREREAPEEAREREFWQVVLDTAHEAMLILDERLRIEEANQAFLVLFKTTKSQVLGKSVFKVGSGHWDAPAFRALLENILPEEAAIEDYRLEDTFGDIGRRVMLVNAKRLETSNVFPNKIILAVQDVTELEKHLKTQLKASPSG